jgi:hypothetical protein
VTIDATNKVFINGVPVTTGIKHDAGKAPMELLPFEALTEVAKVLAFGAKKYSAWNWILGFNHSRLLGASIRHLSEYQQGRDLDEESNLSHLAHAACCILFLLSLKLLNRGVDDRCKRHELPTPQE